MLETAVTCKQHQNVFLFFWLFQLRWVQNLNFGHRSFHGAPSKANTFSLRLDFHFKSQQCDNVQMKNDGKAKRSQGRVPKVKVEVDFKSDSLMSKLRVMSKWQNKSFLAKESRKMVLNPNERWLCVSGKRERASFRPPQEGKHPVTPLYKWHFNLLRSLFKRHFNVNTEFTIMSF